MEPWIETFTGKRFNFLNPKEEDLDILDIAHSLSMQCRYTGHSNIFYSVAEHSVAVSDYLFVAYKDKQLALAGLLHDAAEAYLSDIASPIKQYLTGYQELEDNLNKAIASKFNIDLQDFRIKIADIKLLSTEANQLLPSKGNTWNWKFWGERPTLTDPIVGLSPRVAENLFLNWYYNLNNKVQLLVANG